MMKWLVLMIMVLLTACSSTPPKQKSLIDTQTLARVQAWKQLINDGSHWSDLKRMQQANAFVNQFNFVDDIDHWHQQDYWATPLQTLVTKGGDCEDFAIAKYFTLTAMGMDDVHLRLTYVKALKLNKAHMVVSYYEQPKSEPLVLDNLDPEIKRASLRKDLVPVYSFNGTGLWLAKREGGGQYVDTPQRISLWQNLLKAMDVEAADEQQMICQYQYYDLPQAEAKTRCN